MGISTWFRGKSENGTYMKSILIALGVLILAIILAILLYQWPFSFFTDQISSLEYPPANPIGAWIFSAGFIVVGIIIAPHAFYLYEVLQPEVKWVSKLSAVFVFSSGIGIMGVGFCIPGYADTIHNASGILALGGICVASILSLFPMHKKMTQKVPWLKPWAVILTYGQLFFVIGLTAVLCGVPVFKEMQAGTFNWVNPPSAWPLCEWLLLFSAIAWAVGMVFISQKKPKQ